jgi:hypothetical protein
VASSTRRFVADLLHYFWATIGPAGLAGAQFALALLNTLAFGSFTLLLVTSQFGWRVWGTLAHGASNRRLISSLLFLLTAAAL